MDRNDSRQSPPHDNEQDLTCTGQPVLSTLVSQFFLWPPAASIALKGILNDSLRQSVAPGHMAKPHQLEMLYLERVAF